MGSGGKTTSTTSIDPVLRDAALKNLEMARLVGQLGFVPYKGATVAGMSPSQQAAMATTNQGAAAFGLPQSAVPTGGDMSAYSMYEAALASMAPGQRAFIESLFINPLTGVAPTAIPQRTSAGGRFANFLYGGGNNNQSSGGAPTSRPVSGGSFASSGIAARLPGGVNTANPNSLVNKIAASVAPKQSAPTSASRPRANPKR